MSESRAHYHHGQLRAELVEHARASIEAAGVDAVSLRALARQAGVSHTAVYAHFPTKAALIAAVLSGGYDRLHERLSALPTTGSVMSRLTACALAYHAFSRDEPELFAAMAGPRLNQNGQFADLETSLVRTFYHIKVAMESGGREPSLGQASAVAFWAAVQGLLLQIQARRVHVRPELQSALVKDFTGMLCVGLGLVPPIQSD